MTDQVKGPASYFPSIEKKYGRPVAEWQWIIRESGITKHMELAAHLKSEYALGQRPRRPRARRDTAAR